MLRGQHGTVGQSAVIVENRGAVQVVAVLLETGSVRSVLCAAVLVAGCSYHPGSFAYPARRFPGQRVTIGCLDLSIDRRADMKGGFGGKDAAVLDYQFGNRCRKSVLVDLVRANVIARTIAGDEIKLEPFDPGFEMIAAKLSGLQAGGEAIAYPAEVALAQVCVDAASLSDQSKEPKWLCFAGRDAALADDGEVTP